MSVEPSVQEAPMQQQSTQAAPFRVCILDGIANDDASLPRLSVADQRQLDKITKSWQFDDASSQFPAFYLSPKCDLTPAKLDNIDDLEKELGVGRLGQPEISKRLWIAGRPVPPRALHYQLLIGREIVIAEQMDHHLVWTSGRIFLKPLPRYLLMPWFWTACLACPHDRPCTRSTDNPCKHRRVWKCALGFLFSYAALIRHESDFLLAQDRFLIPKQAQWQHWRQLVTELDMEHIYDEVDERYIYGELRLSRLNKIQYLHLGLPFRAYLSSWRRYGDFLNDQFTWLASVTVFVAIVLTAMQVGLATDALKENRPFQSASYGFTVFSIVGPLAAVGFIICTFFCLFVANWVVTVNINKRRFLHIRGESGVA